MQSKCIKTYFSESSHGLQHAMTKGPWVNPLSLSHSCSCPQTTPEETSRGVGRWSSRWNCLMERCLGHSPFSKTLGSDLSFHIMCPHPGKSPVLKHTIGPCFSTSSSLGSVSEWSSAACHCCPGQQPSGAISFLSPSSKRTWVFLCPCLL